MADFSVVLGWRDEQVDAAQSGDGISRAVPGVPTSAFTLLVSQPGSCPMRVLLQAEDAERAIAYGRARWPHARVTLSVRTINP